MLKNIIIANWKMNSSFDEAQNWVENLSKKLLKDSKNSPTIVLCPPSVMIDHIDGLLMNEELDAITKLHKNFDQFSEAEMDQAVDEIRQIKLGGQDCGTHSQGSFTGDISAFMLKDCGAQYVILGHSERRQHNHESDDIIAQKITQAIKQDLSPILCVGESKEQRMNDDYQNFISKQLNNSLPKNTQIKNLIIAYEPIWSIGSGIIPKIEQIAEIANLITQELDKNKNIINFRVIYGGSVNAKNASEILQIKNIKGLLVGGSSLDTDEFFKIIKS